MTDFFSTQNMDNMIRYTIGATFYVGVASATFSFTTGALFLCMTGPKEKEYDNYNVARFMNAPDYASTFRPKISKRPYYRTENLPPIRRNTIEYV